jgi:hypothetical protein
MQNGVGIRKRSKNLDDDDEDCLKAPYRLKEDDDDDIEMRMVCSDLTRSVSKIDIT